MPTAGEQWRARGEDLLVWLAAGLFAAGLCFVPPAVSESGDYLLYWRPTFHFLAESVRAGVLPLWNPYVGLGRPFLADMQNLVCYPPAYLICLGEHGGVFLLAWLHCLLAVLGMRRLGCALGTGRWQSYFMAFGFVASGALTARWMAGQITYCWGLSYVPWLLCLALRTEEPWQSRRVAEHAGCLALQFLCGHPQVFWISAIGQAVFILGRSIRLPLGAAIKDTLHRLWQFGVACAWCAGLVALVLLPMLELAKQSNRTESTAVFANSYHLAWTDLRYLIIPLWSGAIWESHLLVGTVVVVTGLMGLCRVKERNMRGLLGMLLIGLLIALGNQTPLFGLFYHWLPGYAGFRFQSRAAVLVVVALICGSGIWLSRPHPRLRAIWNYAFGLPVAYALVALVALQVLDLLQGTWIIKKVMTPTCCLAIGAPPEHSFEQNLVGELRKAGWLKPNLPPPRVCVTPAAVPVNYGMIHGYAHFDAGCSLFVRRPWDYLHAMLGVPPPIEKGALAQQVYEHGPFPYKDISLAMGVDPNSGRLVPAAEPMPRAFVVYAAESTDYRTALDRLARGHDLRKGALVESPLTEPVPATSPLPSTAAVIRRFEPNDLLVDVEARTNALLVSAEGWYPGWQAEIDGRAGSCVPANVWMRAVPVPAGRHQVRICFRQNYLLAGAVISLASIVLLGVAVAWPARQPQPQLRESQAGGSEPAPTTGEILNRPLQALTPGAAAPAASRPLVRVVAALIALTLVSLLGFAEAWQVRSFQSKKAGVDAMVDCQMGDALALQGQSAQASAHYKAAVRLGERACELTDYRDPLQLGTLANAYAGVGRLDQAFDAARKGREVALAGGQDQLAQSLLMLMESYKPQKPVP